MPAFSPIASRTDPLTTTTCPGGDVVTACPFRLNAGSSAASTAAATTGKYSGRQPARTAQAAGTGADQALPDLASDEILPVRDYACAIAELPERGCAVSGWRDVPPVARSASLWGAFSPRHRARASGLMRSGASLYINDIAVRAHVPGHC